MTKALKLLKLKCQSLPPLIPNKGHIILQTDTSENYWGAILLKESEGTRRICGYKSEQFSKAQHYYLSSKKEVLAVLKGIKK